MATGRLGKGTIPATTNTTMFQATASRITTFSMSLCNTTINTITFRIAIAAASTPVDGEYIEYDVSIPGNGVWERTGIVASASEFVVVYASATGLNYRAWGFEQ